MPVSRRVLVCVACAVPLAGCAGTEGTGASASGSPTPSLSSSAAAQPVPHRKRRRRPAEDESGAPAETTTSPTKTTEPAPTTTATASSEEATKTTASSSDAGSADGTSTGTGGGATTSTAPAGPPQGALIETSRVPVGGGVVLSGQSVVVTQPSRGSFRGFSSKCTHAGCGVGSVSGGNIVCPCHGSTFAITDGHVTKGPARTSLGRVSVKVVDGWVCRA